jgi:hypothetical protein
MRPNLEFIRDQTTNPNLQPPTQVEVLRHPLKFLLRQRECQEHT